MRILFMMFMVMMSLNTFALGEWVTGTRTDYPVPEVIHRPYTWVCSSTGVIEDASTSAQDVGYLFKVVIAPDTITPPTAAFTVSLNDRHGRTVQTITTSSATQIKAVTVGISEFIDGAMNLNIAADQGNGSRGTVHLYFRRREP